MPRLSVRLSDEEMKWVKSQGRASDVCKRLIAEYRSEQGVSFKTIIAFRRVLESIKDIDEQARTILEELDRQP